MADEITITDIQQDLHSIEQIISGENGLLNTKAAIKRAIESKLGNTIPDSNPLRMYDDYIYTIPTAPGNLRTLVLGDTDTDYYEIDLESISNRK